MEKTIIGNLSSELLSSLIEVSERLTQRELLSSSRLPTRINNPFNNQDTISIYEKFGIKVVGQSEDDNLFYDVILPEGWRLEETNHPLWTELIDDQNRTRGVVFYKSSIGDHDSFINLSTRFNIHTQYSDDNYTCKVQIIMDGKTVIYESEVIDKDNSTYYPILHKIKEDCEKLLTVLYPKHEQLTSYWELTEVKRIVSCHI